MTTDASLTRAILAVLTTAVGPAACDATTGCDCQSRDPVEYTWSTDGGDIPMDAAPEPAFTDLSSLEPGWRRLAEALLLRVQRFYPVWDGRAASEEAYYTGYDATVETRRLRGLVRTRTTGDRGDRWKACLDDIRREVGPTLVVSEGPPPQLGIPCYQAVIQERRGVGSLTMVFRISMMAKVYDYYQRDGDSDRRDGDLRLRPSPDTAPLAARVEDVIRACFPDYISLPPEVGAVKVPDMSVGNLVIGRVNLADALFEAGRTW